MSRLLGNKEYKHILRRAIPIDDVEVLFTTGLWAEFKKIYFDDSLQDSKAAAKEFYYQHEQEMQFPVLWPDKWNCADLAINYYDDSVSFMQELQNDASKIGVKWFKSIRVQTPEDIEDRNFECTMLSVDPKGNNNKNKKKEDYCAFCVGSKANNDFKYVRKGEIKKYEFNEYIEHMLFLLRKYEDITHIYIEKNTYQGADVIKLEELINKDPALKYRYIVIINEMQKKNKDDKISTIVSDVNNGRIIFNSEDTKFTDQVMDFAGQDFTLHDDAADITSEFANRIDQIDKGPLMGPIFVRGLY